MKKILSLTLAAVMCLGISASPLCAVEITSEDPVVNVTVSHKGKLEIVRKPVTVTDVNENGIYDVDDALTIAHEEYCPGGYAKLGSGAGAWISKLWGYDALTTGCGYYVNDEQVGGLHYELKNGDELHAFVYRDWYTESYSCFDRTSAVVRQGGSVSLYLSRDEFGMSLSSEGVSPSALYAVAGATITIDGKSTEYKTDAKGEVTIPFETAGTFVVSAKLTNDASTIVAPYCVVTVLDPSAPIDPDDPVDPVDPVEPIVFTDVKEDDWFYGSVQYVAEKGLMKGMGNDSFAPEGMTTRGQLVTILYRMEGEPSVSGLNNPFTDLVQDWYINAVIWAADKGIVKGITDTAYAPESDITREQAATILYRYAAYKSYDVNGAADLAVFPDVAAVSPYAQTALSWAVDEGLINGTAIDGKTLLDPQGTAIRAQLAAILTRFCENIAQ